MKIPLEDLFADIVGKAQRGLRVDDKVLAERIALSVEHLLQVKEGEGDDLDVTALASALSLFEPALKESFHQSWEPEELSLEGIAQVPSELLGMTVNAYVAWDTNTREAAVFDTGVEAEKLIEVARAHELHVRAIYLTHTHEDHVAELKTLRQSLGCLVYSPADEVVPDSAPVKEGDVFTIGSLNLEILLTNGHSPGGVSYVVNGLSRPVIVVGDSLFAGSMGGAANAYALALKNNREKIMTLPTETLVCPGHGPMTTIANERVHNPFVGSPS